MLDDDELEEGEIDTRSPPPPYCAASHLDNQDHAKSNKELARNGNLQQRAPCMPGAGLDQHLRNLSSDHMRPWDRGKVKLTWPSTKTPVQAPSDNRMTHSSLPKRPSVGAGRQFRSDDLTIREAPIMPRLPPIRISSYCRQKCDDTFTVKPSPLVTVQTPSHDAFFTQPGVEPSRQDGDAVCQKKQQQQQQQQQQSWRSIECKQTISPLASPKVCAYGKVGSVSSVTVESAGFDHSNSSSSATSDHHQRLNSKSIRSASRRRRERRHRSSKSLGSEARRVRVKHLSLGSRGYSSFVNTKRRAHITRKRRASKTSGERKSHSCRRSLDSDGDGKTVDTSCRCGPRPFVIDRYKEDATVGTPACSILEARKLLAQVKKLTSHPHLLASLGIDAALAERIGAVSGVDERSDDGLRESKRIQQVGDVALEPGLSKSDTERSHEGASPPSGRMHKRRRSGAAEEHMNSKRKFDEKILDDRVKVSKGVSNSCTTSNAEACSEAKPSLLSLRAAALATMSDGRRTMGSQRTRAGSELGRMTDSAKAASPPAADSSSLLSQCPASVSALPSMPSAWKKWPQPSIYGATGMHTLYSFPWLPYWAAAPPPAPDPIVWPLREQQHRSQPAITENAAAQVEFKSQSGRPVLQDKPVNVPQQLTVGQKQGSEHVESRSVDLVSLRSSPNKAEGTSRRQSPCGILPAGAFWDTQSHPMQKTTAHNEAKRRAYHSFVGEVSPTLVIEDVDDCSEDDTQDAANHHATEEWLGKTSASHQTTASRNSHEEFAWQLAEVRCHLLEVAGSRSSPKSTVPASSSGKDGDEDKRLRGRIEMLEAEIHRRRSYGSAAPASVT